METGDVQAKLMGGCRAGNGGGGGGGGGEFEGDDVVEGADISAGVAENHYTGGGAGKAVVSDGRGDVGCEVSGYMGECCVFIVLLYSPSRFSVSLPFTAEEEEAKKPNQALGPTGYNLPIFQPAAPDSYSSRNGVDSISRQHSTRHPSLPHDT